MWRRLLQNNHVLPACVFILFMAYNATITGPAYLSDEAAYLSKAATVVGSTVHHSTSWFGGYSILLSPAYLISSNPFVEWYLVMALNALMWAGCLYLLRYLLRRVYPKAGRLHIELAAAGALLYPSWIAMSGYAFSTSGFVFVLLLAFAAIAKSELTNVKWLSLAALATGYLYWIHPFAAIFIVIFVVLCLLQASVQKRWQLIVAPIVTLAMVAGYSLAVHLWFFQRMASGVGGDTHYSGGLHKLVATFSSPASWDNVGLYLMGLLFYVVIASFGLVIYAALPVIGRLIHERKGWRGLLTDTSFMIQLLAVLSVAAMIGFSAVLGGTTDYRRIDQWVYGRYTDMYVLPLLAIGLLAQWRMKKAALVAGFVVVAGVLLSLATSPENTSFAYINKVNLQSLWSMYVALVINVADYWLWGIFGAIGILIIGFASGRRKFLLSLMIFPVALAGLGNSIYHHAIIQDHATVSSLYDHLRQTYTQDDPIGFSPVDKKHTERFQLYAYYLHGYDVRRMSLVQWQNQQMGPYLTHELPATTRAQYHVVGKEQVSNLYLIVPASPNTKQSKLLVFD